MDWIGPAFIIAIVVGIITAISVTSIDEEHQRTERYKACLAAQREDCKP